MYHALASLITWHGDYTTGLAATERAYDYARAAGDVTAQAEALRMRGITLCLVGRTEPGVAALQQALALAETAGERKTLGRVLQSLGEECHYHDTLERALPYYRRALAVAEQSAVPSAIINGLARLADVTTDAGIWAETHTYLDRLDVLLREPGTSSAMLVYFWGVRGALALAEGRRAEAAADLERAVERARREDAVLWTTYAQLLLAERDILDGRPQEARRRVEPFLALRGKKDDFDIPRLLAVAAWAALEQGDEEQAQVWLDDVLGWALGERHFWSLFYAWRVLALMAIRHGRWEVAEYAAEQVLPLTRRGPFPAEEIKARYTRGLVHAARGEGERAHEEYRVALSICDRLGEGLYRPHIERALADLGQQRASSDAQG
jgi:tetratricopeptide (TPR) repeat protein